MLADGQHRAGVPIRAATREPHDAADGAQSPPHMNEVALDEDSGSSRHRTQVGDVEGTADAHPLPEARARDQAERQRRANVEDGGGAPAVQVPEPVAVSWLHGELEGDARMWRRGRVRDDGQAGQDGPAPLLRTAC